MHLEWSLEKGFHGASWGLGLAVHAYEGSGSTGAVQSPSEMQHGVILSV